MDDPLVAGLELGGTNAILVLGRGRTIERRQTLPTLGGDETLAAVAHVLASWRAEVGPLALGVASFGPVGVRPSASDYGRMLPTTKPGWSGVDVLRPLLRAIGGPAELATDVTAAALAEGRWGAATGLDDHCYVTIGTGIGVGIVAGGRPVTGAMHPEAGHIRVARLAGDGFPGVCPFHGDCLEGLASGPAVAARAGRSGETLSPNDPVWTPVAHAIAEGFATLLTTVATRRIVVGGGLGVGQPHLLDRVRARVVERLNGYLPWVDADSVRDVIVPAALGGDAGPLGALLLGTRAARKE